MSTTTGAKRELYKMMIDQMKYDGYGATAQKVAEDTLTTVPCEGAGDDRLMKAVGKSLVDQGEDESTRKLDSWNTVYSFFGQGEQMINRCYAVHGSLIRAAQFSQDGQYLVAADASGATHLYLVSKMLNYKGEAKAASTAALARIFDENTHPVEDIQFSPRAPIIFTGSKDGFIRLFNYTHPKERRSVATFRDDCGVNSMAMHPSGYHILSGCDNPTVRLWDLRQEKAFRAPDSISDLGNTSAGSINSVDFSPDGKTFVSGNTDGTMKVWDPSQPKWVVMPILNCHCGAEVTSVQYSKAGTQILTAGKDACVRVFDTRTFKCLSMYGRPTQIRHKAVAKFTAHEEAIAAVLVSKSKVAIIDRNMKDNMHLKSSASSVSETHYVRSLAVSPTAPFIAAGDEFKTRLWTPNDYEDEMLEGVE